MKKTINEKYSKNKYKDIVEDDVFIVNVNGVNISFRKDSLTDSQKSYRKAPISFFRKLLGVVATSTIVVLLAFYALIFILVTAVIIMYDYYWSILIAIVVLIISVFPVLRSIAKRNKFYTSLRKFEMTHEGVQVVKTTKKYSSLFSITGQTDLQIKTAEANIEIMFLPTFGSLRHLLISREGDLALFVKRVPLGNLGRILNIKPRVKTEKISFETLTKENGVVKVVLLNPVPHEFSVFEYNKHSECYFKQFSGPGEKLDDYYIDNTSSLFRRIESYL